MADNNSYALLGGGCFWCLEACYLRIEGVVGVVSGYAGGSAAEANYGAVSGGDTGHVEVVRVEFDPQSISYQEILQYFWSIHDPTQMNRQGADVGTQYRSVIFYYDDAQLKIAAQSMAAEAEQHKKQIVTALEPAPQFYPAEGYHQSYFDRHPGAPYCIAVIRPKLRKAKLQV